jgi:hypothetical protein
MQFSYDGEDDTIGLEVELALQMKLNAKLSFQGVFFDGDIARVVLPRVTHLSDILASHKTDIGSATYVLLGRREAFVAHMVQLVSCSSYPPHFSSRDFTLFVSSGRY